jgi:hypothetical protein
MNGRRVISLVLAIAAFTASSEMPAATPVTPPSPEAQVTVAARDWWDAFARGDTTALETRTAPLLSLTLSTGRRMDRAQAMAQTARHTGSRYAGTMWSDEQVRVVAPGVAIAASTAAEGFGKQRTTFRYLTVLERKGSTWRVSAAQSTRVLEPTPRVPAADAGDLAAFAGAYMTPSGVALRIGVDTGALAMVEPGGGTRRLEPTDATCSNSPTCRRAAACCGFFSCAMPLARWSA